MKLMVSQGYAPSVLATLTLPFNTIEGEQSSKISDWLIRNSMPSHSFPKKTNVLTMKSVMISVCCVLLTISNSEVGGAQQASAPATTRLTAPQLFPEKTLAYVRIDDVRQLKADLGSTSMGKLGNDEQLKPILSEFYGSLVRNTAQLQDAIGLNLDELLSIPSGEMSIALLPSMRSNASAKRNRDDDEGDGERGNDETSPPAIAVLLDAGQEISSVQVLLNRMHEAATEMVHEEKAFERLTLHRYQHPERRRQQFAYFIDDGVIIATSDPDYAEVLASRWLGLPSEGGVLADNRKFTSMMARCVGTAGERPQVSFYVDPLEIVRQLVPRNAGTTMVLAMLPALGIDGIEAVGGSAIIAPPDFDSISHFHVSLGSPRRGVLSLLRPKSGSTSPEAWVPDSVAGYSTINWDLASTLQGIERLFNQFRGDDALNETVFAPLNNRLDLDFRKDILDNLEGRITILQGFVRPVRINSGSNVYAVRLKNPEYVKNNVLPKLLKQVEQRIKVTTEGFGKLTAQVFEPGREQAENNASIRMPEVCVAFIDDYVVVADSRYMMRQLADCSAGGSPPLKESLEYQLISDRIAAQLQDKECSAISFARPEESLQMFYELARDPKNRERLKEVSENNPFFKALLSALESRELPPFSVIAKYLAPSGGYLVEEDTGLHYMSFTLRRE